MMNVWYLQGRPPLRLQNSYQFKVQKTNPKTSLLDLLVLIMTTCPFLLCCCKRSRASKACNRGTLRLGEAWARPGEAWARPGEAWARPRLERKICWAWPRFSCCFAALTTKRMSGRGICGSSCCAMMSLFLLDLPFYWYWPIAHCTIFLTAYVSFRTVPQSIYGQSRAKKKHAWNAKRIGTRTKRGSWGLRNYIILLLKSQEG